MDRQPSGDSIEALYKPLRRFAAIVAPLDVEPDDLLQEAVVRAAQLRPLGAYENLAAYLRVAMLNLVRSEARHRVLFESVRTRLHRDAVTDPPSDLSILDMLKPVDRALVFMVDVEGFTFAEASEAVGLSQAAARQRTVRARRRLRRILEEEDHG